MRARIGNVILHLHLHGKPLKSGKYPVYIRVQYANKNRYYSCNCEMSQQEWERFEKEPDQLHTAMKTFSRFEDAVTSLLQNSAFSFPLLSTLTERNHTGSVQEIFNSRIEELRKNGSLNTANLYFATRRSIDEFCGSENYPLKQISKDTIEKFIKWLDEDKGNKPTSISMKLRCLHAILEKARKDKLIAVNPMDNVKKPVSQRRNLTISEETLSKLLRVTSEEIGERRFYWLCFWRCIFYGNGMNIGDLLRLKESDIDSQRNEIVFHRRKTENSTKQLIRVAIIPQFAEAMAVISGGKRHLIPILDGVKEGSEEELKIIRGTTANVNHNLKAICEIVGISETITTSTGRHAFATKLLQKEVPIEYISRALGHSSVKTTLNYLDEYTETQVRQYTERLVSND